MTTLRANVDAGNVRHDFIFYPPGETPPWASLTEPFAGMKAVTPLGIHWAYNGTAWVTIAVSTGEGHPSLAIHNTLGLATQSELDAHNHSGTYEASGAVATHAGQGDPHPGYLTPSEGTAAYSALGHTHAGGSLNLLKTTGNQTINAGAGVFADITGLTFTVVNGVDYAFYFYITFQSAATATGWKAGVNCPAGTLDFWAESQTIANGAAGVATHTLRHNVTRDDMTLLLTTVTQAVDLSIRIEGRYRCTAGGTFAARFANELAANTQIVVQQGSWGWWF